MKDNKKNLLAESGDTEAPFKGYTMEELRYQRAMMALRKEFCKTKVMQSVETLRPLKGKESQEADLNLLWQAR